MAGWLKAQRVVGPVSQVLGLLPMTDEAYVPSI
jgi:hypothetical protein